MDFKKDGDCSSCAGHYYLNEYGICAECWLQKPYEERSALENIEIVEHEIHVPVPGTARRVFEALAAGVIGGALSYGLMHWMHL